MPANTKVTEEQIEAARPLVSWLPPWKLASVCRYFLRRDWKLAHGESDSYASTIATRNADFCLWQPGTPGALITGASSTLVRMWLDGHLVITGPDKDAVYAVIARLRATSEAEGEDSLLRRDGRYRFPERLQL